MRFGILDFPQSICTDDLVYAVDQMLEQSASVIDFRNEKILNIDVLIISDYLEDLSQPIVKALQLFEENGGRLLAIGEGVKTLIELGLLPGRLAVNKSERLLSQEVELCPVNMTNFLTNTLKEEEPLRLSVSGSHCRWVCNGDYETLVSNNRVLFRYHGLADEFVDMRNEQETIAGLVNAQELFLVFYFTPKGLLMMK